MIPPTSIEMALYWNETLTDDLQLFFKRRLKNNDLAADLTQETYLRFHNWLKEGPPDNARALAFSIAVNLVTDYQRKAKVRSQYHADIEPGLLAETQASAAPGPEQIVISHERLKLFHSALDELPVLYRSAFLLHNIDGMTYPEVAACLGISESTVYKYLTKTISHCLKRLEEQD